MDDALALSTNSILGVGETVLILVVMDDALARISKCYTH